jgi:hypothetical protein
MWLSDVSNLGIRAKIVENNKKTFTILRDGTTCKKQWFAV